MMKNKNKNVLKKYCFKDKLGNEIRLTWKQYINYKRNSRLTLMEEK